MLDTVDGIIKMRKLMNWPVPEHLVKVDEDYLDNINYYHDAFSNVTLVKQKDTEKVIAYRLNDALWIDDEDDSVCPECGAKLITKWSGVKCSKCDYWFCY